MSRFLSDLPEMIGLDLDGMVILSIAAKFDNESHLNFLLSKTPVIKKIILNLAEIIERVAPIEYKLVDFKSEEMSYLYESMKYARNIAVITNRSRFGFNTLLEKVPNFQKIIKKYGINCIQVRKSVLNAEQLRLMDSSIHIIETSYIKPNEAVFYPLINYAERSGIERNKILIVDDNKMVRVAAKKLGLKIFPNDVITTQIASLKKTSYAPRFST